MTSVFDNPDWKNAIEKRTTQQLCDEDFPVAMASGRTTKAKAVIDALEMQAVQPSSDQIQMMAQQMAALAFTNHKRSPWTDLKWISFLDHLTNPSLAAMGENKYSVLDNVPNQISSTTSYAPLLAAWSVAHPKGPELLAQHIKYQNGVGGAKYGMVKRVFGVLLGNKDCLVEPIIERFTPEQRQELSENLDNVLENFHRQFVERSLTAANARAFPEYKKELLRQVMKTIGRKGQSEDDEISGLTLAFSQVGTLGGAVGMPGMGNFAQMIQGIMQNKMQEEMVFRSRHMDAFLMVHEDILDDQDKDMLLQGIEGQKMQTQMPKTWTMLSAWDLGRQVEDQASSNPAGRKSKI